MSAFFAALQFLTLFPYPRQMEHTDDDVGRAAIFFPVIGGILGSILVLVNVVLEPFANAGLLSVILVSLLAFLTRGLHLDGVGDTFDGLGAGGDRGRMLSIMDDSHTGVFGLIAIVLVLLLKIHALEGYGPRPLADLAGCSYPGPLGNGAVRLSCQSGERRSGFAFDRSPAKQACSARHRS